MKLTQTDLLTGEELILSKPANAMVDVSEYGKGLLIYSGVLNMLGPRGIEGVGGKLHLTNYRLIFKSHIFNRTRGTTSIYLPTIQEVEDTSFLAAKTIKVSTPSQSFVFLVWGIPALLAAIKVQREGMDQKTTGYLKRAVMEKAGTTGTDKVLMEALELANVAPLNATRSREITKGVLHPFELSRLLNEIDLVGLGATE